MPDYVSITPGSGSNIGTLPLTMPDSNTANVSVGIIGTNITGTWTPIASGNPFPVTIENGSIAVTGTFWQTTQPVSVASLPLPTGAATSALQTTGNTSLASLVSAITVCNTGAVVISSGTITANAGSGTFAVSASALPLPTGAATSALQTTGNASLVSLVSAITTCNTGAVTISTALPAGTNVIGHVIADSGSTTAVTGNVTVVQGTAASLKVDPSSVTSPVSLASLPALTTGSATVGYVNAIPSGDTIEIAGTTYAVLQGFANVSSTGTILTGTSLKKIRVLSYTIGPVSAAVNVYFFNTTTGAITSTKYLAANGGMGRSLNPYGHFQTGTNGEDLEINLSTVANVGIDFLYILV